MAKKVYVNYNVIVFEHYEEGDVTVADLLKYLPADFLTAVREEKDVSIPVMMFIVNGFQYWMLSDFTGDSFVFKCVNFDEIDDIRIPT